VSRLGESDPQPARHDDLLLLAAAVGHVDVLRERLDAHAERFSPLTSAEVRERAAKHVLAVERVAEEVERHAESASSFGRRARTDGHKLYMDDIGTGRSTRPPLTADERDALEAAGGHAAQRAREHADAAEEALATASASSSAPSSPARPRSSPPRRRLARGPRPRASRS
jgi:hypothetical protein